MCINQVDKEKIWKAHPPKIVSSCHVAYAQQTRRKGPGLAAVDYRVGHPSCTKSHKLPCNPPEGTSMFPIIAKSGKRCPALYRSAHCSCPELVARRWKGDHAGQRHQGSRSDFVASNVMSSWRLQCTYFLGLWTAIGSAHDSLRIKPVERCCKTCFLRHKTGKNNPTDKSRQKQRERKKDGPVKQPAARFNAADALFIQTHSTQIAERKMPARAPNFSHNGR